jgi:carbamoyltransferase
MSIALHETGHVRPLPAVRHVDGTSRVQCVDRDCNPRYHALIEAVGQQNGVPAVLNTSLNARDEPIAMRPGDALRLFATTPLNAMVMGNTLIRKARS